MKTEPDRRAVEIIVASLLYYSFNLSPMVDAEFDALCERVAGEWKGLDPLRRWQLGSPEDIRVSGFAVKTTQLTLAWAIGEAERLLGKKAGRDFRVYSLGPWRCSKRYRVHWLNVSQFQLKELT